MENNAGKPWEIVTKFVSYEDALNARKLIDESFQTKIRRKYINRTMTEFVLKKRLCKEEIIIEKKETKSVTNKKKRDPRDVKGRKNKDVE
ncbi:hypothetical protein M0R19_03095 [Candidatus Pacearchaeota archaeon]|jgi:hypothetical protein|nr:hypothetical protein [Candidatus Pacearchaeota archaeon]